MTPLDAMKQALEALEKLRSMYAFVIPDEAITNLRTAITELESAEPVAWVKLNDESDFTFQKPMHEEGYQKLYAAPIESKHWEITAKQLGKQLDECERERDELLKDLEFQTDARIQDAKDAVANCKAWSDRQLVAMTKERDELSEDLMEFFGSPAGRICKEQLASVIKQRDELVAALEGLVAWAGDLKRQDPAEDLRKARVVLAEVGAGKGEQK